ncbi:MAG: hypothetical protein ABIF82_14195 [Planctomycetota bacterium]
MQGAKLISVLSAAIAITLAARCEAANTPAAKELSYFYLVAGTDGAAEIKEMTSKQATSARAGLQKEYQEIVNERARLMQEWTKTFPGMSFPVPELKSPRVGRLGRVPANARQLTRETDRHNRRLEIYSVCLLKDSDGQLGAEVIRQDQLHAKVSTLQTKYVEAALAWAKANPGKKLSEAQAKAGEQVPRKPTLSETKQGITSKELAKKHEAALAKRIESAEKKKANSPPAAERPPRRQPQPEPQPKPDPNPPAEEAEEE